MSLDSGFNLGDAHGRVLISTNVAEAMTQARQQFQSGLQGIGSQIQGFGNFASNLGAQISLVGAPIALIGQRGISAAADFDAAMAMISARTGLVGDDLNTVRQLALQMGADTAFSSQQAADGFLNLLSAGLSVEQAVATLPAVLDGAAASGEQLGLTADYVTNVMSSFRLEAGDATRIVQTMSDAASASPASMGEMGQALQGVGGIASTLGIGLEQTSAILAIFANNGIRGSEAGTQLRSMLNQMTSTAAPVQEAWQRLGVSMFDTEGNMRDINVVMAELDSALSRLPIEEQNRLMQSLAGSYGIVGFSALRAGVSIDDMMGTMSEQADVSDVAAIQMNTFKGTVDSLKGSVETLMIEAFTPYMNNVLKPMMQRQTALINQISTWVRENAGLVQSVMQVVFAVISLGPPLFIAGRALVVVGGILTRLNGIMSFLLSPLRLINAAFMAMGAVMSFVLSPIGLLTLAMGGLYVAWRSNFLGIQDTVMPIIERIRAGFRLASSAFATFQFRLDNGSSAIEAAFATIAAVITNFMTGLGLLSDGRQVLELRAQIEGTLNGMVTRMQSIFAFATTVVRDFVDGIRILFTGDFVGGMFSGAQEDSRIVAFWLGVRETILGVFNSIRATFARVINALRPMFAEIGVFLGNLFQNINLEQVIRIAQVLLGLTNPVGIVLNILRLFGVDVIGIFEGIVGAVTRFFAAINAGGDAFTGMELALGSGGGGGGFFSGLRDTFSGIVLFVTDSLLPTLNQIRVWFVDEAGPAMAGFVTGTLFPAISGLFTFLANAWNLIAPTLAMIVAWFVTDAVPAIVNLITTALIPALQALFSFLGQVWAIVGPALGQLAAWFLVEALPVILNFISGVVIPFISQFIGVLTRIWTDVSPFLLQLLDWVITSGFPIIVSFIQTVLVPVIQFLIDTLVSIWTIVGPVLASLYTWFVTDGLPAIMTLIQTAGTIVQGFIDIVAGIWAILSPVLTVLRDGFVGVFGFIADFVIQPVITLIQSIVDVVTSVASTVGTVIGGIGDVVAGVGNFVSDPLGSVGNLVGGLLGRDNGGDGVAGRGYLIGPSQTNEEIYVPRTDGTFIPNAVTTIANAVAQTVGGGQGGAPTLNFYGTINANSHEEGQRAYEGFSEGFLREHRT